MPGMLRSSGLALAATVLLFAPVASVRGAELAPLDRGAALALARATWERAAPRVPADLRPELARLVPGTPRFDGAAYDPWRATALGGAVTALVTLTDARDLSLAIAAAALAYDPSSPTAAGNLASALVTAAEDAEREASPAPDGAPGKPGAKARPAPASPALAAARAQALALYRFGLAGSPQRAGGPTPPPGPSAVTLLVNAGNLLVAMGRLAEAKALLDQALVLAPFSWPAHQAMAGCWLAAGKPDLAAKEVASAEVWPRSRRKAAEAVERASDEKVAPTVDADEAEESMEEKLARLRAMAPTTQADEIEDLSVEAARELRRLLRRLEDQARIQLPPLGSFAVYGNLEAFSRPAAKAQFEEWHQGFARTWLEPLALAAGKANLEMLKGFGITVENFDPAAAAAAGKRGQKPPKPVVKGAEELKEWARQMKAQLAKRRKGASAPAPARDPEAPDGDGAAGAPGDPTGGLGDVVAELDRKTHQGASILLVDPAAYANPTDVVLQKANYLALEKKQRAYHFYLAKVIDRVRTEIADRQRKAAREVAGLSTAMATEVAEVERRAREEHWDHDKLMLRRHAVHQHYFPAMNAVQAEAWSHDSLLVNDVYVKKLKPNLEAMWSDCFRHVLLVSDPEVRAADEAKLQAELSAFLTDTLTLIAQGYGGDWNDDWDCDCDMEALEQARQAEAAEEQAAQEELRRRNREGRRNVQQKVLPETSQLYRQLDVYSTTLKLPLMEARIGLVKSSITFRLEMPGNGGESGALTFQVANDHLRETVRLDLAAEASLKAASGTVSGQAKVYTKATITLDNDHNVTEWDVAAGATATGAVTVQNGALGTTSLTGTAGYEASIMKGNAFTVEVAVNQALSGALVKNAAAPGSETSWRNTSSITSAYARRQVLWSGRWTVE